MDPDGQDGKHPHPDHVHTRHFAHPQQSLIPHNAQHQHTAPLITLPAPNRGPAPPGYGPSPSPSGNPRVLPNPNISPPLIPTPPDSRYGQGQPPPASNYPARSFSLDSGAQRPTGVPVQPGREGVQPSPATGHPSAGPGPSQMDHPPQHGSAYGIEHHAPNGLPHHAHSALPMMSHEPYQQAPPAPSAAVHHGYHPGPSYAHPGYGQSTPTPYDANQLRPRKAVRAQQACQQCRQRKQKCDEGRPRCGFCEKENMQCEYRETQPPKQDRTILQILEGLQKIQEGQRVLQEDVDLLKRNASVEGSFPTGSKRKRSAIQDSTAAFSNHAVRSPDSPSQKLGYMDEDSEETLTVPQSADSEMVTPVELLPHVSSSANGNFQHAQQVQENIDAQKRGEIPFEVGGIPADHTTSVSHLRTWPGIKALYDEAGYGNSYDVTQYEQSQGFLRVYGLGQTGDVQESYSHDSTAASPASDNSDPIEPEGLWGSSHFDGHLRLDEATVMRLYDSYFRHFHILHPFLDRPRLKRMLDAFLARYKSASAPNSSPFAIPAIPGDIGSAQGSKRPVPSHLGTPQTDSQTPTPDYGREVPPPSRPVEKNLQNAILLLVLALGKIAEHKRHLRGPAKPHEKVPAAYNHSSPQSVPSPSSSVRPSPTSSHTTVSSLQSPPHTDNRYDQITRTPGHDGYSGRKQLRNIDVFPGLAYYALAADILDFFVRAETVSNPVKGSNTKGSTVTGSTPNSVKNQFIGKPLHEIWAFILAGLYMGQLCRAMESFGWIQKACKAWVRLSEEYGANDLISQRSSNKDIDLVKFAYWTCLQLESDLRAECDFEPTGIGNFENRVALPNGYVDDLVNHNQTEDLTEDIFVYCLQIHLRRTLNRTHSYVYGREKQPIWEGGKDRLPGPKEMLLELNATRGFIETMGRPVALRNWRDENPLSPDINISRVRGKYYGARYVILRPFLQHAMHKIPPQPVEVSRINAEDLPNIHLSRTQGLNESDREYTKLVIAAAKECIDAAMLSTEAFDGLKPDRFLITNIHGTALAQFGNMLVLCAAYHSWLGPSLANLVPREKLIRLLHRTIELMANLAALSKIMEANEQILKVALKKVLDTPDPHVESGSGNVGFLSAHSSFSS